MEMCPVCINESSKKHIRGVIDGVIYYFCCEKCKNNFLAEPRKYINCCHHSHKERNDDK